MRAHQVSDAGADVLHIPQVTGAQPISRTRGSLSRLPRWPARAALAVGALLLTAAATGAAYEAIAANRDAAANPPPGRLVDVGGHRLHISCVGTGSPTVVFESGLAGMSADWANVQPQIGSSTRACAYDRAGIAWSDSGPEPRDPSQIARELHALLINAGESAPYVLAGHSFGGLYVRVFAATYPDEVAGLVLVDASHPDMWQRVPPEVTAAMVPSTAMGLAYRGLAHLGFTRLTSTFPADCGLASEPCAQERAWLTSARQKDAYVAEMGAPERDAQARANTTLGATPLVVLTASEHADIFGTVYAAPTEPVWRQMQNELAELSTNSVHYIVDGATHGSLQTKDAAAASAAIEQVVQAVRTGKRLTFEPFSPVAAQQTAAAGLRAHLP
jgi:pimeloyl-ACP methyl ester carboxylesterase